MNEIVARIRAGWDNLTDRERLLIGLASAILAGVLVTLAIVAPLAGAIESAETRVETAEQQLQAMMRLRRDYDGVHAELTAFEEQIRSNSEKRNVLTLLESLAEAAEVKIDSVEQRQASDSELYKETRVEVGLRNVSLNQVVGYLHNIETAERKFSIKSLRIKTRPDKPELLDVNFMVSSFEPI